MKAARWLLGLASAATCAGAIGTGCGGSSTSSPAADSGADVTMEAAVEAAVEAAPEAAPEAAADVVDANMAETCAIDSGIESFPLPDGDIPDTNLPISACVSCLRTDCPQVVSMCDESCECKTAFAAFDMCIGQGGSVITCAETDLMSTGISLTDLGECALGCTVPCGINLGGGDGGKEGGKDSGSEGGKDSGKDGSKDTGTEGG